MDTQLLTVNEVAKRVRVNPRTVRRWIDSGKLPAVKVVNNIRVKSRDIEKIIVPEARPTHARKMPDWNAITDKIERMLAARPYTEQPGETQDIIEQVRAGREEAIMGKVADDRH